MNGREYFMARKEKLKQELLEYEALQRRAPAQPVIDNLRSFPWRRGRPLSLAQDYVLARCLASQGRRAHLDLQAKLLVEEEPIHAA